MGVRKLHLNIRMKLLAGVLASWVSAQYSFYDYEQTYYASGKSQVAQSEGDSPEVASVARTLGNGRICWSCLEETYTACLGNTAVKGDEKRHGAAYCQGEDYFCYISERRIIRHNENEWNYENGNPWQDDTSSKDHASGTHVVDDEWRKFSWMNDASQPGNGKLETEGWGDRRFGATERHFQRGKGTESVCHYCCDPYLEYNAKGCNNVAATAYVAAESADEANPFMLRSATKGSLDWAGASGKPQYHGAFRNPHTQREKEVLSRK